MVQWLRLRTPEAGDMGSIPGRGTKIPQAAWCGQKKKKKVYIFTKILYLGVIKALTKQD